MEADEFEEARKDVAEIRQFRRGPSAGREHGRTHDKGNLYAPLGQGALAGGDAMAVHHPRTRGTIVARENDCRARVEPESAQFVEELAHLPVHIGYGSRIAQILVGGRGVAIEWCRLVGGVHENHGVVEEKRLIAVRADEFERKSLGDIRTIFANMHAAHAIGLKKGIPISFFGFRISRFNPGPDAVVVKAVLLEDVDGRAEIVDLPFARDGGCVALRVEELRPGLDA